MRKDKIFKVAVLLTLTLAANGTACFAKAENIYTVERVIDGNTLVIRGGQEIRLIGVLAPDAYDDAENKKLKQLMGVDVDLSDYGRQAKDFVKFLVEGKQVRLEVEPDHAPINYRDKAGRILAHVWFVSPIFSEPPDWLVVDPNAAGAYDAYLNACIVRAGMGALGTSWPFRTSKRFLVLQYEAVSNERGIWKEAVEKRKTEQAAS